MKLLSLILLFSTVAKAETVDCMSYAGQVNPELSKNLPGNKSRGTLESCLIDFDVTSSTAELNANINAMFWQRGCVSRFCTDVYKYRTDIIVHATTDSSCRLNLTLTSSDNNVITNQALQTLKPFLLGKFEALIRKNEEIKRICHL